MGRRTEKSRNKIYRVPIPSPVQPRLLAQSSARGRRLGRSTGLAIAVSGFSLLFNAHTQATDQANRILVLKTERKLVLYKDKKIIKTYKIALGRNSVGPKTRQGDHRTPEGVY